MHKKYLTLIILITFAVVLNILVLGMLGATPFTQNNENATNVDISTSKVMVSIVPSNTNVSNPSPLSSTDKLSITSVQTDLIAGSFLVSISNHNSSQVAITNVFVNSYAANLEEDIVVPANSDIKLLLTLSDGVIFARTYQIRVLSSEGQSAIFYKIVV